MDVSLRGTVQMSGGRKARRRERRLRKDLIGRIKRKIAHRCLLSSVGLVIEKPAMDAVEFKIIDRFYSMDGLVIASWYDGEISQRTDHGWEELNTHALKEALKAKVQTVFPKNAMVVLAEAADGVFDECWR
jgi:hypothetical protein